jgi:hypothetical protein
MNARPDRIPLSLHHPDPLHTGAQAIVHAAIATLTAEVMNRTVADVLAERWPQQKALSYLARGTTTPITSTGTGAALVAGGVVDLISVMGAASASSALLNAGIQLLFTPGMGSATIQNLLASAGHVTWLGEGQPISVRQLDISGVTALTPKKTAGDLCLQPRTFQALSAEC